MGAALGLLASLLWGAADYGGGVSTRRTPVVWVILVSQLAALICLLIACAVALLTVGLHIPPHSVAWGAAAGAAGVGALGAFYTALSTGTMGVVAPIASTGVIVPVVVSIIGGERPGSTQVAGMAVAALGIIFATGPEFGVGGATAARRSVLLAALAGIGFGFVALAIAKGSTGSVLGTLTVQRCVSILIAGLYVLTRSRDRRPAVRELPTLVLVGLGDGGANAAYAAASRQSLVSVAAVLSSLYPVVTALLAARLDRERMRPIQVMGVSLAMAGVLLLAAG